MHLKNCVIYSSVLEDNFCIISSSKKNTRFYIYVTLIVQRYMKCILENSGFSCWDLVAVLVRY